ncbi:MAG: hypothetical protein NVSMB6_31800 [Burkholderiaceae bacterium]
MLDGRPIIIPTQCRHAGVALSVFGAYDQFKAAASGHQEQAIDGQPSWGGFMDGQGVLADTDPLRKPALCQTMGLERASKELAEWLRRRQNAPHTFILYFDRNIVSVQLI